MITTLMGRPILNGFDESKMLMPSWIVHAITYMKSSHKMFWRPFAMLLFFAFARRETVVHAQQQANHGGSIAAIEPTNAHATALPVGVITNPSANVLAQAGLQKRQTDQQTMLWRTPLLYYGKVLDESNQPISGVRVSYGGNAVDIFGTKETRNQGFVTTDERGIFKIDGLFGIGLMFQLSHPNYYPYPDNSTGFDVRSRPRDGIVEDSEEHARIFRMHSKGHPVHLVHWRGGFHAPNNGSIASFPLRGATHDEVLGQLQIKSWSGLRSQNAPYDWKVELTVPNGGIIGTTDYFDFVAPSTGYSDRVDFEVSGSENMRQTYFVKLPAGYLRFKLEVIMGKDMFVTGDYYFNPDGSSNLESDSGQ
jgi:hypothetical protein